jgi:tetratricopeptide (TPR) repeat protein
MAKDSGRPPILLDIETALRAGDRPRATDLARRALDTGLTGPALLALRARWHEEAGRLNEACTDLDAALQEAPGDPAILIALARCLAGLSLFAKSASAAREAIAGDAGSAAAHYHLAFAQEQLGELDKARLPYERALALAPTMADAAARLASLAGRRGDWAEARARSAQAQAIVPGHAVAILAEIMAELGEHHYSAAEAAARLAAEDTQLQPPIRASAFSFLGDALDGQDRTDEAFKAYTRSNAMRKAMAQARFERPGAETGSRFAARLLAEFNRIDPAAWMAPHAEHSPARTHVFVLGFPRSGTTLLAEVLAGHPDAALLDEQPVLRDAILEFTARPGGLARLAAASPDLIAQARARYWQRVEEAGVAPAGRLVIDKVPLNTLHLPIVARLFPDARIVFALRDPRDTVFGCFRRLFALNPFLYEFLTLGGAAGFYDTTLQLAERYRAHLPLAVHELRNEDLRADAARSVGTLCEFLGIEPDPAMTDFAARTAQRAIASPDAARLAEGIESEARHSWRRYEGPMKPVLPVLAPWVRRFGYEP